MAKTASGEHVSKYRHAEIIFDCAVQSKKGIKGHSPLWDFRGKALENISSFLRSAALFGSGA